jgi:hypothetical protein
MATLLLEKEIPHLRTVSVCDDQAVGEGEAGHLPDRNPQVPELFFDGAGPPLLDEGISPKGHQQGISSAFAFHRNSKTRDIAF